MFSPNKARGTFVPAYKTTRHFFECMYKSDERNHNVKKLVLLKRLSLLVLDNRSSLLHRSMSSLMKSLDGNKCFQRCHYTTKKAKNKDNDLQLPKQDKDSVSLIANVMAKKQMLVNENGVEEDGSIEKLTELYESMQKEFSSAYLVEMLQNKEGVAEEERSAGQSEYYLEDLNLDDIEELPKTRSKGKGVRKIYGTADPSVPFSKVPCAGCGAKLHCQDSAIPGYMPKEKFVSLKEKDLRRMLCQKCYLITYNNFCLNVRATPEEYYNLISSLSERKGLIVLVVDITDITNSMIQNLPQLVGRGRSYFIIGNKIDLLPGTPQVNVNHCKTVLHDWCVKSGLDSKGSVIRHLCLVSAKTGFGVEELVTKLLNEYDHAHEGDVFLLGSTNSGKSTLFNALLSSDYCKYHVRDVIHRATVSRWPGTTIELLKFPIITPTGQKLKLRTQRLIKEKQQKVQKEKELIKEFRNPGLLKNAPLTGVIGQTDFIPEHVKDLEDTKPGVSHLDLIVPPSYTFISEDNISVGSRTKQELRRETNAEKKERELVEDNLGKLIQSKWLFDTPGLVNSDQVINLLTPEELAVMLPTQRIQPRSYVLKPGQVMFVSGLGRIDYFQGPVSAYFTVIAAKRVPVHVINPKTTDPDKFYEEALGTNLLGVPLGDLDRLLKVPSLIGHQFWVTGIGWKQSVADIVLSSIGFVSITAGVGIKMGIRAYTPGGRGCRLHTPALLPAAINMRGERLKGTAAYRVRKKKQFLVIDKPT